MSDYPDGNFQDAVEKAIVQLEQDRCEHNTEHTLFDELSPEECREIGVKHWGAFHHVYKCSRCGKVEGYDSSG